jgi:hypothetical protein
MRQPLRRLVDLYMDSTVHARERRRHGLTYDLTDDPLIQLVRTRLEPLRSDRGGDSEGTRVSAWLDSLPSVPSPGGDPVVQHRAWHGWQAYVDFGPLAHADAAVLVGCTELLGDRWNDPSPPVARLDPVRATWWPASGNFKGRWINWPWVTHSTFWGYERAIAWLAQADALWANQPDAAFGSWVAVMTAQLFHASSTEAFDVPACPLAFDCDSLAGYLRNLDQSENPLSQAWLDAVGLLCTPEMGMDSQAGFLSWLPSERAERIRTLRTDRAKSLPPHLRERAGIPARAGAETVETVRPRARARRPANRGES